MRRPLITFVALFVSLSVQASATICEYPTPASIESSIERQMGQPASPTAQTVDPVILWNRILLEIVRTPPAIGAKPSTVHPTRSFAIMHTAIYTAVNEIERTHSVYLIHVRTTQQASPEAAAATAAHDTLMTLYPKQSEMLDARLAESLAQIPDGTAKSQGISVGQEAARLILAVRRNDGSHTKPTPYIAGTNPGDYQKTPPKFPEPAFTNWSHVKPFALISAKQFRPGPPPALTGDIYDEAFQEIKKMGGIDGSSRTTDQTEIGKFWGGSIQNYWNEIAQAAALAHGNTLAQNARLFALLNLTFADAVIAFFNAKYAYHFWRPVTAVRAADKDKNPRTSADPHWSPLIETAPDPSYPGAHSVISAAGAATLSSFFGSDDLSFALHSEKLSGVERSFTSFTAAAEEAGLSRIYSGQHYRFDHIAGQRLGREVGKYVYQKFLVARRAQPLKKNGRQTRRQAAHY